jgi:hypothetical protein
VPDLKPLSAASVPSALAKVERYRLLNEPAQAESICRDVLAVEPENQQALHMLVLALSDQIADDAEAFSHGVAMLPRLQSEYDRAYYGGILWERRARARFQHPRGHGWQHTVHDWTLQAMRLFEEAEKVRPQGNDDAILRWNTCVRFLHSHPDLAPHPQEERQAILSE